MYEDLIIKNKNHTIFLYDNSCRQIYNQKLISNNYYKFCSSAENIILPLLCVIHVCGLMIKKSNVRKSCLFIVLFLKLMFQ